MKKFYIKLYYANDIFLIILLSVIIIFTTTLGVLFEKNTPYRQVAISECSRSIIVIDAGHGGEDSGAVSASGILEKDVNLLIAKEIGRLLTEKGFSVVYTRTEDKLLYSEEQNVKGLRKINDLKNRCSIANAYPDSIFISIHCNSFSMPKYSGLQVYYSYLEESRSLANTIQERVRADIQPDNNRRVKEGDNIYLMENVITTAVLIECGFLSNEEESKRLWEKEYQNRLSFSIVCGIIEYIENQ